MKRTDQYAGLRVRIKELFHENRDCYGYRRIYLALKKDGIIISEKVVRRIMHEESLEVFAPKRKK